MTLSVTAHNHIMSVTAHYSTVSGSWHTVSDSTQWHCQWQHIVSVTADYDTVSMTTLWHWQWQHIMTLCQCNWWSDIHEMVLFQMMHFSLCINAIFDRQASVKTILWQGVSACQMTACMLFLTVCHDSMKQNADIVLTVYQWRLSSDCF